MIEIDNDELREQILEFLLTMKDEQLKLQKTDPQLVLYSQINLKYAVKNKIIIPKLLSHKCVIKSKKYYETSHEVLNEEELVSLLNNVLEYELTSPIKDTLLTSDEINVIIKYKKKLETKLFKKEKANGKPTTEP
jgi:hypothetical protein